MSDSLIDVPWPDESDFEAVEAFVEARYRRSIRKLRDDLDAERREDAELVARIERCEREIEALKRRVAELEARGLLAPTGPGARASSS
ncbi:MAG: hypothetical protein SFX73_20695 [Kofleriaceae bacterium]|nr:hypothetical protein [Kofleriaceae bacterium]